MSNWILLEVDKYDKIWNSIFLDLSFRPYDKGESLICLPSPSVCFNIADFYDEGFKEELYTDLHECATAWFKQVSKGERLYAVDWQHDGYSFYPYADFEKDEFGEWLVPVFPNGDYLFFLTEDFQNGIFANGIGLTISFFGKEMLEALSSRKAKMLVKHC